MGQINVTNVMGSAIQFTLVVNGTTLLSSQSLGPGVTSGSPYNDKPASHFADLILTVVCNNSTYKVDLNKDNWFGDNHSSYPGSDFDINLILMGLKGASIQLMQAYCNSGSPPFSYCNDLKSLDI